MTSKKRIVIIGAGGFGREVFYLLNNDTYECVGFINYDNDDNQLPAPIIGHESNMENLMNDFAFFHCVLTIGDIQKRKEIFSQIKLNSLEFPVVSHSSVKCFSQDIGKGNIIYPGAVIMNDCRIGKFTLLNSGVTLGHDIVIGDFCNINPGVNLAGRITVGDCTLIGIGASIKENIIIGSNVVVGAGSVVINDVPDNSTVYGVPARIA